jgi:hypothetical protein
MADKFKVGDKVRLIKAINNKQDIGKILIIDSSASNENFIDVGIKRGYKVMGGTGMYTHSPEDWLEPVYDGDQASNWSLCAWQPNWIKSHG